MLEPVMLVSNRIFWIFSRFWILPRNRLAVFLNH